MYPELHVTYYVTHKGEKMARIGVDFDQVSNAVHKLLSQGENPTVDSVRQALGGTGSKSTIAPLLRRWKAENVGSSNAPVQGLPTNLAHAVRDLYETMQASFANKKKLDEAEWNLRIEQLTSNITELNHVSAKLETQRSALNNELALVTAQLSSTQDELFTEQTARRELELGHRSLEQRLSERTSEVGNLHELLSQGNKQLAHFQEAARTRWNEQRENFEHQVSKFENENGRLREQLQKEQMSASHLHGKYEQIEAENARLSSVIETLNQHNADQRTLTAELKEKLAHCVNERRDLEHVRDEIEQRLAQAQTGTAVALSEISILKKALSSAEDRANVLTTEKVTLVRQNTEIEMELRHCKDLQRRRNKN
jgi:chromosome segregation ATPase